MARYDERGSARGGQGERFRRPGRKGTSRSTKPPSSGVGPKKRAAALRKGLIEFEKELDNFADRHGKPLRKSLLGRGLAVGGALSFLNPFGLQIPGLPSDLWVPPGLLGRDVGLICYTSPCTPISGPHYIGLNNSCDPFSFPACPFGVLTPGQFWGTSYQEALVKLTGSSDQDSVNNWPFALMMHLKTGLGAGYYVHEIQQMATVYNVEILDRAKLVTPTAPWTAYGNPNLWPYQEPDNKLEPEPKTETARQTDRRPRVTTITMTRRRNRTPPRIPPRVPRPGLKEAKVRFNSLPGYRLFMGAIDAMTETQDFIRAIYGGLPCSIRSGRWRTRGNARFFEPGPGKCHKYDTTCQMNALNKFADDIDWNEAWANVIANQVEDQIIGRQQRAIGDLTGATKSEAGYARFKAGQQALKRSGEELLTALRNAGYLKGGCK